MNKEKILKLLLVLVAIVLFVAGLNQLVNGNSMTLSEYAASKNPSGSMSDTDGEDAGVNSENSEMAGAIVTPGTPEMEGDNVTPGTPEMEGDNVTPGTPEMGDDDITDGSGTNPGSVDTLIGASLNGNLLSNQRSTHAEGFYYEPVSDNLRRFMTGVSYPALESAAFSENDDASAEESINTLALFEDLRYVHIYHYNFEGKSVAGELICHRTIAQDLVEIFYELYQNEYQLGSVLLIDTFDGDISSSAEANNSFCFYGTTEDNFQTAAESLTHKHGMGLAVDINPLYNPVISYTEEGAETIFPEIASDYAHREKAFPYKIDENDLCYKLFTQHGFVWGGNRNSGKAYGHFHKNIP